MSLNSLAASYVARDIVSPDDAAALDTASDDTMGTTKRDVQNALSALVEYVPAETVALYLASMASLSALQKAIDGLEASTVYWLFVVMTPVLFALIFAGKQAAASKPRWPGIKKWPWWPMIAATLAFMAWGITVPDGPYLADDSGRVVSGLLAIFVSTLLGVVGRFLAPAKTK